MGRPALLLVLALVALSASSSASGKGFATTTLVMVGSRGDSLVLRPSPEAIDELYRNAGPVTRARGPFVKLHPLAGGGFPGMPGRLYVRSRAVCMGWNRVVSNPCFRPKDSLFDLLRRGSRLVPFRSPPALLARLVPGNGDLNLRAAVELAFGRLELARARPRPAACILLAATWRARADGTRPVRFCLSRRGIHARGRLYPLGAAVWKISGAYLR